MKKKIIAVALMLAVVGTSCIGPFALTHKVLAWNQTLSENKFVNAIVFFIISPAYTVSMFADAVLFNTIEFYTGDNPIQAGIVKEVQGENGTYLVETTENGYDIKAQNGEEMKLILDKKTNTWSYESQGESSKIITITDENNAIVYLQDGTTQNVELNERGMLAVRQLVESKMYYAQH